MPGEREMPRKSNCCLVVARHPDATVCCTPLTISTTRKHGYAARETQDLDLARGSDRVARGDSWQGIDGGEGHWRGRCMNRRRNGSNAGLSWWCCMAGGGGGGDINGLDNGRGGTLLLTLNSAP
jgi:hypothetical protein